MPQAKRGRAKPKHKQTGKKRSKGKQSCVSRIAGMKKLRDDSGKEKYVGNLEDYEPIRKQDSDEDHDMESDMGDEDLDVFYQPHTNFEFLTSVDLEE